MCSCRTARPGRAPACANRKFGHWARARVVAVEGADRLEGIVPRRSGTDETCTLGAAAMFVFIGTAPHSEMADGLVLRDEKGYIPAGPDVPRASVDPAGWRLDRDPFLFETSVPGVFAAGDVRAGANHRVAMAVGEGSAVVHSVHRYLETVYEALPQTVEHVGSSRSIGRRGGPSRPPKVSALPAFGGAVVLTDRGPA